MRRHFRTRHPQDIIIIQQEGILPQCNNCGIFKKNAHTQQHINSKDCQHYANSKKKRKQEIIQEAAKNVKFLVGQEEIVNKKTFKYLGRIINDSDDDLPAVESQLQKARQVWARISRIIQKKTNGNIKIMSTFYKSIVQTILLYGSESWVLTQFIINKLNSFHHMCARHITGRHIRLEEEVWIYPDTTITLQQANLLKIEKYIEKRRNKMKNYVHTLQIYEDCRVSRANSKTARKLVWWTQRGENEDGSVVTESSANSERGLPLGIPGTVDILHQ
jgi:5'(3')-deoxyribonucleotidase